MFIRKSLAVICFLAAACVRLSASHLVTGNGFGFAVVQPENGAISKFYAHPYSFTRPDPANPLSEGIETASFLKSLRWGWALNTAADYVQDSQVIRIRSNLGSGTAFMPFGLPYAALIVSWAPAAGAESGVNSGWKVEWNRRVSAQSALRLNGTEMTVVRFDGIEEALLLFPLEGIGRAGHSTDLLAGSRAWALISLEQGSDAEKVAREFQRWRGALNVERLAAREMDQLEHWRVTPRVHFADEEERHLWRQSEVMLRIAQSREPNRADRHSNGLMVASLPDGVWFTPWVRDMAYGAVAFARMGHRDEARAALLAYFNAQPTGKMRNETRGADYQVSVVRYFGDGSEEPFFTQEGSTNIEFDDWGLALWVLGEYLSVVDDPGLLREHTHRGTVYESARDFIVKPLVKNFDPLGGGSIVAADTSIWEERQKDAKHFAFSTAMAIVGLRRFAEVAHRAGDEAAHDDAMKNASELQKGFDAAFIRNGKLHGTLEKGVKNDIDGALLPIIHFGVVRDPAVIEDTLARMELLRVASGGYRRVRGTYTDPAIYEYWYEQEEFLFVDFSLAEVYRQLGRHEEAAAITKRIVEKAAADHNIIPEMYVAVPCKLFPGEVGDPTGALPMVGYGAGEFILHLLDRENSAKR